MEPHPSGLTGVVEAIVMKIYGVQFIHHHRGKMQRNRLDTQGVKKGVKTINTNTKPETQEKQMIRTEVNSLQNRGIAKG